ncbi:hypothetical protein ROZALSC1DRAFT_23945, partial [Rozella allomycis CSF55]
CISLISSPNLDLLAFGLLLKENGSFVRRVLSHLCFLANLDNNSPLISGSKPICFKRPLTVYDMRKPPPQLNSHYDVFQQTRKLCFPSRKLPRKQPNIKKYHHSTFEGYCTKGEA